MDHTGGLIESLMATGAILVLACGLYLVSRKVKQIPYPVLLFFTGLILSSADFQIFKSLVLEPEMVLFIFLPILLFESAFHFDYKEFRKILLPGFLLSTIGLIVSALIIALLLNLILNLSFVHSLIYGAVISSTDPIAVLTILKSIGVPKKLQLLLDGESFLNDATSVIGYRIVLGLLGTGAAINSDFVLRQGVFPFLYTFIGGLAWGMIAGFISSEFIALIKNVKAVEITITIILATLVFAIGEAYLHVSGIIAVLGAGLVLGNYGKTKISPSVLHDVSEQWEFFAFLVTAVIFFLIGYEIKLEEIIANGGEILLATLILTVARFVSIIIVTIPFNLLSNKKNKIPFSWIAILNWGSLRGVLPLVVLLSLPDDFENKTLYIQFVLAAIISSMLFNAITLKWVISFFKLDLPSLTELIESKFTELLILQGFTKHLTKIHKEHEINDAVFEKHKLKVKEEILRVKEELAQVTLGKTKEEKNILYEQEIERVLRHYYLQIELSTYKELYAKDIIDEQIFSRLSRSINWQSNAIDENNTQFREYSHNVEQKLQKIKFAVNNSQSFLRRLFGMSNDFLAKQTYLYYKARMLGNEAVLDELEYFLHEDNEIMKKEIQERIYSQYKRLFLFNLKTTNMLSIQFKDCLCDIDEKVYTCEASAFIEEAVKKLGEDGKFSDKALKLMKVSL